MKTKLLTYLFILTIIGPNVFAQHFMFERTDQNHSILIDEATINDELLENNDEIGVMTEAGVCAGAIVIEDDDDRFPAGLVAWGSNDEWAFGFNQGEEMSFLIWSAQEEVELQTQVNVINGDINYNANGFTILSLIAFLQPEINIELDVLNFGQVDAGQGVDIGLGIENAGLADLLVEEIDVDGDFFSVDFGDEINVEPGEQIEIVVTFALEGEGEAEGVLIISSNDPENEVIRIPLLGEGVEGDRNLQVHFDAGWNMISINVIPSEEFWEREEGPDIVLMFEQLRIDEENHQVNLVKNESGEFYSPSFNFNNIPYWDFTDGYQVKVNDETEAEWQGEDIDANADIPLAEGWNNVAYFPTYELDANRESGYYALSPIIDHGILAKNSDGQFLRPEFNFSNMNPWRETQGYQIKVDADVVLNYPEEREEEDRVIFESMSDPINLPTQTGSNMSLLVTKSNLAVGDYIIARSANGLTVGSAVVDADGQCGLAVWGDDPSTDVVDGLVHGETFDLKILTVTTSKEAALEPKEFLEGKSLTYSTDDFVAIKVKSEYNIPARLFLSECFPNPFNSTTTFNYVLPNTGQVRLSIYDSAGRLVKLLSDGWMLAGDHKRTLLGSDLSAGVYLLRLEGNDLIKTRKVVLLK